MKELRVVKKKLNCTTDSMMTQPNWEKKVEKKLMFAITFAIALTFFFNFSSGLFKCSWRFFKSPREKRFTTHKILLCHKCVNFLIELFVMFSRLIHKMSWRLSWPLTCWKYQLQMIRQSQLRMLYKHSVCYTLYPTHHQRLKERSVKIRFLSLSRRTCRYSESLELNGLSLAFRTFI